MMVRRPVEHPAGAQALLHLRTLLGPLLSDGSDSQGQTLQTALSCCAVADSCEGALSCLKSAELRGMHDVESLAPFANKQSTGYGSISRPYFLAKSVATKTVYLAFSNRAADPAGYLAETAKDTDGISSASAFHPKSSDVLFDKPQQGALLPFAQGVLGAGYKLVLCGFRIGGAKAQQATAKLLDHFSVSRQVQFPEKNVVCVTFGAPQILTVQAKAVLDQARYSQHVWNIIVEGDAMPGIMGAVVKTDDKHWPSFQSALEEAWAEPVPDTELLKEKFCGGEFLRPGRLYCSLGKVLVIGKDGGLLQPTEQDLKKKTFYAGAAHAEDQLDVTWQLSVMEDGGYFSLVQQMLQLGMAWRSDIAITPLRDLLKEGLKATLTGTFAPMRQDSKVVGFSIHVKGSGACWLLPQSFQIVSLEVDSHSWEVQQETLPIVSTTTDPFSQPSCLQVNGKLSVPAKHVADPVVFRFATCFEEGCTIKLTRGEDISAESDKERAAQCGPRELTQRLLRLAYSLCLQNASGSDQKRLLASEEMTELGRAFLEEVHAIEGFCRKASDHMSSGRFPGSGVASWPSDPIMTVMEAAISEVKVVDDTNERQAKKEQELGLTDYMRAATAATMSSEHKPCVLEEHWCMIAAILGQTPAVKTELSTARKCVEVALSIVSTQPFVNAWHAAMAWLYPGYEPSHLQKMALLKVQKETYSQLTVNYQASCEFLSKVLVASGKVAARTCDKGSQQASQTAEARLVQQLKEIGIVKENGFADPPAITKLLHDCEPTEHRWTDPKTQRHLTKESMRDVVWQMAATAAMLKARKRLEHFCFVGMVGAQNAGKSTLVHALAGIKAAKGATGYTNHTEIAAPFLMHAPGKPDSMILMDFPAMDAPEDHVASISTALGGDVFAWVLVIPWNGTFNMDHLRHAMTVLSYGHPVLICVNKARMFVAQGAIPDNETVTSYIRKWRQQIDNMYAEDPSLSAHKGYDVVMTEFKDATSPGLDIKNTSYVQNWIQELGNKSGYDM